MAIQTPVEIVVQRFGGTQATARALSLDPSAVAHWKQAGRIPGFRLRQILITAERMGITITAEELIWGSRSDD
jgi:hypothetical protein